MKLPQLRVFNFAVIRGFIPLGVAQTSGVKGGTDLLLVIRRFMPLGVAQFPLPKINLRLSR